MASLARNGLSEVMRKQARELLVVPIKLLPFMLRKLRWFGAFTRSPAVVNGSRSNSVLPRLAFVSGGLRFGGSTTFLCNIGGELVKRGLPVLVLSLEKYNAFVEDFAANQVPVVALDDRTLIFEDRMFAAVSVLAKFQPTAVIGCLGTSSYEVLRYVPSNVTRAGLIQADHAMFYDAVAPCAPFMDALAGVSEQIRQTIEARSEFAGIKALYLPYGVSIPSSFAPRRSKTHSPLRILYFGRLQRPQKRVQLFPAILRVLVESGIPFVWNIVGEGEEASFLKTAMKTHRPDQQVVLRGKAAYHEVPDLLEQNDVFLLASDVEGLPLSLLEAMAHGLVPVISDLASGVRELLEGDTGCKVPIDDTAGYAKAMIWLQRNPGEMERRSRNAREKVQREFSVSAMTDRWLSAFPASAQTADWPQRWKVQRPLTNGSSLKFSPAGRVFRRWIFNLRRSLTASR